MDWNTLLMTLMTKFPVVGYILVLLGTLVILAQTYVALTPTQNDDAWFAKLEGIPVLGTLIVALKAFAPVQRKEPPKT